MARLWSSGFELGSNSIIDWSTNATASGITSSLARTGTYSINPVFVSGSHRGIIEHYASGTINGPIFARFCFRYATLPSASNTVAILGNTTTFPAGIKLNTNGTLGLYDEDGQIGSNSSALSANTWYRVEMYYDTTGGAGAGAAAARIDGTEFASSTTRSSGAAQSFRLGTNVLAEAQTTGNWYFDDLAINDNSGGSQTSYPGAGSIVYARPNGDGDTNQSSGTYADLDEVTPDDATTISVLDVDNDIIDVAIQNSSDVGIGASDTINLIQVGGRHATASAASATWNLRIKSQTSGTVTSGTAITSSATAYFTNDNSTIPELYTLTSYVDPQAGGAWTPALLDTAQIGAQATDATPDLNLSALWAAVEFVPFSGQTVTPNAIASTTTFYSPTITTGGVTVTPNAIAANTTLYSPAVTPGAVTVSPNLLAVSTTLYSPNLTTGAVTVTPNALAASTQIYQPTVAVGAITISPNLLASATSIYSPTVGGVVLPPYRLLRGPRRVLLGPRGVLRGPRKYR